MEAVRKRVRVGGVLVEEARLLLMHYRYGGHDRYNLPGGNPELGEPLAEALRREFQEELGLSIRVGEVLWLVETRLAERDVLHVLFRVQREAGSPPPRIRGEATHALDLLWLSAGELPGHALYPEVGEELGRWLAGEPIASCYLGPVQQPWFEGR